MRNKIIHATVMVAIGTLLPFLSQAQTSEVKSMEEILNSIYDKMIPLSSKLIDVGRGIAGFAALWYIAYRVWRHIANAEPIDFFPLLRPFVIGLCILMFPAVLGVMNGVLKPTVTGTKAMLNDSHKSVRLLLDLQEIGLTADSTELARIEEEIMGDPEKWSKYEQPANGKTVKPTSGLRFGWGLKAMIKRLIADLLYLFYQAAALVINTIRTFKLVVLAILGPLVLGLSVFDGFHHSLKVWIARYINVFLWLPIANIFGAIISRVQENMIRADITGGSIDPNMGSTNTVYLIFLVIGICGYFTVPRIAGYIINTGGHALLSKTAAVASTATSMATGYAMREIVRSEQNRDVLHHQSQTAGSSSFMKDKIAGKA